MSTVEKPKRRSSLGCLFAVLVLLLIPVLCYGSMWLFVRYGGEWATSSDIPVQDNSQSIAATYDIGYHITKHSLYLHYASPEKLRGWYIVQAHIGLTPIALDLEKTHFIDNPDFYMEPPAFHQASFWNFVYQLTTAITHSRVDDVAPDCQAVRIYKNHAAAVRDFPDLNLPDDKILFVISTFWLNVN